MYTKEVILWVKSNINIRRYTFKLQGTKQLVYS